jgi:hypothetical protein
MTILKTAWRRRGKEILEHRDLAQWFERQSRAHAQAVVTSLPSMVASILSLIHDWPTQDATTDLDCFCLIIMSKDRFEEEYAKVRDGAAQAADLRLSAEHKALEALIQQKATQGKHRRAAAGEHQALEDLIQQKATQGKHRRAAAEDSESAAAAAAPSLRLRPPAAAPAAAAAPGPIQADAGAGPEETLWAGLEEGLTSQSVARVTSPA